ncbi:MAG: ATP-binding protein [Flexilinea sp.]
MVNSVYPSIKSIYSNISGYSQIAQIATNLDFYEFSSITIDMQQMIWCDGNMCSPLGAILYRAGRDLNDIVLENIPSPVEKLLCKNGFLASYGRTQLADTYGSTIQYRRFEPDEDRVFNYYLDEQFRNKAIPEMSAGLHKKFIEGLMEIFSNAVLHSDTKLGIFVCGQYFHQQHRLDFTITDLGIGICRNLLDKIGLKLAADQAIDWAAEGNNTTKRGRIPGGLGLKLLREFIRLNQGRLQIISDTGFWEQYPDGRKEMTLMTQSFPGTIVNIEINTADQNSYRLSTEQEVDIPF